MPPGAPLNEGSTSEAGAEASPDEAEALGELSSAERHTVGKVAMRWRSSQPESHGRGSLVRRMSEEMQSLWGKVSGRSSAGDASERARLSREGEHQACVSPAAPPRGKRQSLREMQESSNPSFVRWRPRES